MKPTSLRKEILGLKKLAEEDRSHLWQNHLEEELILSYLTNLYTRSVIMVVFMLSKPLSLLKIRRKSKYKAVLPEKVILELTA